MPDLTEYSNHGYNGSASVSAVDMNNQHIRLNNSAPPFESNRNCNAVISDTQSKGPSPVQSEEWNRKKKVKRAENAPVLATAHKSLFIILYEIFLRHDAILLVLNVERQASTSQYGYSHAKSSGSATFLRFCVYTRIFGSRTLRPRLLDA